MKKAQGMSLNVIIIAALGLLVLVILAIIFTGKTGAFVRESDKCEVQGGQCITIKDDCVGQYKKVVTAACDLSGDGKYQFNDAVDGYCCVSVAGQ